MVVFVYLGHGRVFFFSGFALSVYSKSVFGVMYRERELLL